MTEQTADVANLLGRNKCARVLYSLVIFVCASTLMYFGVGLCLVTTGPYHFQKSDWGIRIVACVMILMAFALNLLLAFTIRRSRVWALWRAYFFGLFGIMLGALLVPIVILICRKVF